VLGGNSVLRKMLGANLMGEAGQSLSPSERTEFGQLCELEGPRRGNSLRVMGKASEGDSGVGWCVRLERRASGEKEAMSG